MCCVLCGWGQRLCQCCRDAPGECGLEADTGLAAHDAAVRARRGVILWFLTGVMFTVCVQATALTAAFAVAAVWYAIAQLASPLAYPIT